MTEIETRQTAIIEEFADFSDWQEKYEYIIELGFDLPALDDKYKNEEHRIMGCQSNVWLHSDYDPQQHVMLYDADSDSMIVKGLVSMLVQVLNKQKPEEIITAKLEFLNHIGLDRHLSSTRSNGLASMIKEMRQQAALHVSTAV